MYILPTFLQRIAEHEQHAHEREAYAWRESNVNSCEEWASWHELRMNEF